MITLALRSLLVRKLPVLAALLSAMLGAGLVTATMLIAAAQGKPAAAMVTSWQFGAVDAVVKPPANMALQSGQVLDLPSMPRLSDAQIAAIGSAPGVSGVSLERPFPAYVVVEGGTVVGDALMRSWGHPWSTAVADGAWLTSGSEPRHDDEIVIDESIAQAGHLRVGDRVRVQLAAGTERFTVTGTVSRAGAQFEHAVFFTNGVAARIGGAPVLALGSTSNAEALSAAVPALTVATGEARAGSLQLDLRQAELVGGSSRFLMVVAGLALLIAVFVISSTLTVSITQRRRELAMLRVLGTKPNLIRWMIVWEAMLLGLVGGAVGSVLGIGLASLTREFFVAQNLMARGAVVAVDPGAMAAGAGAALAAALAAALLPARRATKIAPLDALRESDIPATQPGRRRAIIGCVLAATAMSCLAGTFTLGGPIPTSHGSVAITLLVLAFPFLLGAAALLGTTLLRGVVVLLRPLLECRFAGFIAVRSIRSDLRRAAGVSVPLTLLVAVGCVLMFQDSANYQATFKAYARQVNADLVIAGDNELGVPPAVAKTIVRIPGVAAASPRLTSQLIIDRPPTRWATGTVIGVEPRSFSQVLDFPVTAGSWSRLGARGVGVSRAVADDKGWELGDRITFFYPDGSPGSAVVSTIFADPTSRTDLVLPVASLAPHLLEPLAGVIYVKTETGADRQATQNAVQAVLHDVAPNGVVVSRSEHLAQVAALSSGDNWIIMMFVVILGGYAGMSAVNVLIGSTMARRREFALLRLAGSHRGQIVGSLAVESLVVAVTAVIAGTAIAFVTMTGYGYLLTDTLWLPFVVPTFWVIVGCAFLAAAIGTLAPSRTALRADPLEAMR